MSLAIKYETVDDARLRLKNTVVLYKGQPVLITEVKPGAGKGDDIIRVKIRELPLSAVEEKELRPFGRHIFEDAVALAAEDKSKYISSKFFDIAPFKMGYVNRPTERGAFYCKRSPNRVQKQGLCSDNFIAKDNYGEIVPFHVFSACKEVLAMVENNYPSFDQAVKALDKVLSVAFHREFALAKDDVINDLVYLYYKGSKVGMCLVKSREVTLGDKFKCLKEALIECGLRVSQ